MKDEAMAALLILGIVLLVLSLLGGCFKAKERWERSREIRERTLKRAELREPVFKRKIEFWEQEE